MHALLVKAVPSCSFGVFSVPFQVLLAVIVQHVVFPRHEEYFLRARTPQDLVHGVKFFGFREVAYIPRVQHEFGWRRQTINFVYGRLQCPYHIQVRRLIKSHVAVADLHKAQLAHGFLGP